MSSPHAPLVAISEAEEEGGISHGSPPRVPALRALPTHDGGVSRLYSILEHNARFVESTAGARAKAKATSAAAAEASMLAGELAAVDAAPAAPPARRRIAVVSCMDARLVELLPAALDLRNADAKVIKTAGAILTHPFGGIMRSIIVAIYALHCEEVMIVGHLDCGMSSIDPTAIIAAMHDRGGIARETVSVLERAGINVSAWLSGFDDVAASVASGVEMVRRHPLVPATVRVHGLVIDPATGALEVVVDGNEGGGGGLVSPRLRGVGASEPRIASRKLRSFSDAATASVHTLLTPD